MFQSSHPQSFGLCCLQYCPYVQGVEFHEVDTILVLGPNFNSIFANGSFKGNMLAVCLGRHFAIRPCLYIYIVTGLLSFVVTGPVIIVYRYV